MTDMTLARMTEIQYSRLDYRRKAFEYLARANTAQDSNQRTELLSIARMWMQLFEPLDDMPSHFELPKCKIG